MAEPLLAAHGLYKAYGTPAGPVQVLQGVDLEVAAGERVAITGASGVGKSTLLHVLGTLDRADQGSLAVAGRDVLAMSEPEPNPVVEVPELSAQVSQPEDVEAQGEVAAPPQPEVAEPQQEVTEPQPALEPEPTFLAAASDPVPAPEPAAPPAPREPPAQPVAVPQRAYAAGKPFATSRQRASLCHSDCAATGGPATTAMVGEFSSST